MIKIDILQGIPGNPSRPPFLKGRRLSGDEGGFEHFSKGQSVTIFLY
jgi:hypothetical protein